MGRVYFGFDDYANMCAEFQIAGTKDAPPPESILFASYGGADYEGDAIVLFARDGRLFEVHGSHCSCYGLEGCWEPEETTISALRLRDQRWFLNDHGAAAWAAFQAVLNDLSSDQPSGE